MTNKTTTLLLVCLALVSTSIAERQPFSRYESIVNRQMFGAPPPGFDPTKMPSEVSKADQKQLTKEQEQLKSAIHFSVINVTPDGQIAVGFTDNSDSKGPIHYYLKVGESRGGWEVKAADPAEASMTIAKGDIEVSLKIGGNSAKDAGATTKAGGEPAAVSPVSAPGPTSGFLGGSLRAKRQLRVQQEQAKREQENADAIRREAERLAQAEAEKAKHEAEMSAVKETLTSLVEAAKRERELKAAESAKQEAPPPDEEGRSE